MRAKDILIAYPDDFHITLGIIFSYHCHHGITSRVCDLALRTPFATPVHYYLVEDTIQVNKIESSKCLANPLAV
jgi:hypothetical protein